MWNKNDISDTDLCVEMIKTHSETTVGQTCWLNHHRSKVPPLKDSVRFVIFGVTVRMQRHCCHS